MPDSTLRSRFRIGLDSGTVVDRTAYPGRYRTGRAEQFR